MLYGLLVSNLRLHFLRYKMSTLSFRHRQLQYNENRIKSVEVKLEMKWFKPPSKHTLFDIIYFCYKNKQRKIPSDQVLFIFHVVADLWNPLFIQYKKWASFLVCFNVQGSLICQKMLMYMYIMRTCGYTYHMKSLLSLAKSSLDRFNF